MSPCSLALLVASFCTLFCSQLKKINSFNSWYSLDFHFLVLCFTNSWSTYQNKMEDLTKGAMWRYINTHWLFDFNCRVDWISWTHNIIDTLLPCPLLGIIYVFRDQEIYCRANNQILFRSRNISCKYSTCSVHICLYHYG